MGMLARSMVATIEGSLCLVKAWDQLSHTSGGVPHLLVPMDPSKAFNRRAASLFGSTRALAKTSLLVYLMIFSTCGPSSKAQHSYSHLTHASSMLNALH